MSPENYPPGEAERRIDEAVRNQARELNLSHLGLSSVPGSIGRLPSLTSRNLGNNQLTGLPDWISQLTSPHGRATRCGNPAPETGFPKDGVRGCRT